MFLVYSIPLAFLVAWCLGGRLASVVEHRWRMPVLLWAALGLQIGLFTAVGAGLPREVTAAVHVGSYGLLFAFMAANAGAGLAPVAAGAALNAIAIVANGGFMPVSRAAWAEAFGGAPARDVGNAVLGAHHNLAFLGDVMALPPWLPLGNVFSIGDVLIAVGVVVVACRLSRRHEAVRRDPRRLLEPARSGAFRRFWAAGLVSDAGDWLTTGALVAWMYQQGGTRLVVVTVLVRMVPPALVAPLAGAFADRTDRRSVMVASHGARIVAMVGLAGAVAAGRPAAALALLGGAAVVGAFHAPASGAYLPRIVPGERIVQANALLGFGGEAAMVVGLAGGGLMIAALHAWLAVAIDAATFAVAAVLLATLPGDRPAGRHAPSTGVALQEGLAVVARSRELRALVGGFSAAGLATGFVSAVLAEHAARDLNLGSSGYGLLMASLAGGLVVGHLAVGAARGDGMGPAATGIGLCVMGLALLVVAGTGLAATAALGMAVAGIGDGVSDVLFQSSIQERVPNRLLGRVFGLSRLGIRAGMVTAAAIVIAGLEARAALWTAAVALVVAGAAVVAALRPGRRSVARKATVA